MNILSILICLGLERYLNLDEAFRSFNWFTKYVNQIYKFVNIDKFPEYIVILLILFPVMFITALIQFGLMHILGGVLGIVFNIAVLFFSLNSTCLEKKFAEYFTAKNAGNLTAASESINQPYTKNDTIQSLTRSMTITLLRYYVREVFGVLFWFLLGGGFGALTYRLVIQLNKLTNNSNLQYKDLHSAASNLLDLLDWIPVRITTLIYSFAGNFTKCFGTWLRHLWDTQDANDAMLINCGLASVGVKDPSIEEVNLDEDQAAIDLLNRTLIIALVCIALLSI